MKVILIFAISLVCSFQTFAQTESEEKDKQKILVGIKFYPGFSDTWRLGNYTMGWSTYIFSPKIALNGGLSFLKEIKKNFIYLEAEILSLNRGYKLSIVDEYKREETIIISENLYYSKKIIIQK